MIRTTITSAAVALVAAMTRPALGSEVFVLPGDFPTILAEVLAADDGDGVVDTIDSLARLGRWSMVSTPCDVDGGRVDTTDFLALMGNRGPCP